MISKDAQAAKISSPSDGDLPPARRKKKEPVGDLPKARRNQQQTPVQQWQGPPAPSANNDIKLMQQEIINFHDDLRDVVFAQTDGKDFKKGTEPFLKYMLDNYSKQSGNTVTQYNTNNPSAAPGGRANPADSWRGQYAWGMRQMLASLDKVGQHSVSGENKPDGHWGILTNRALQNIAAFAWSMIQLAEDVKLPNPNWTFSEQEEFKKLIPQDPKDANSQVSDVSNTTKITEGIHKIRGFWKSFYTQIFSPSGQYGKEVGQTVGFSAATINPSKVHPIKENMSNLITENKDNPLYPKDENGKLVDPGQRWNQIYNNVIGKIPSNLSSSGDDGEIKPGKIISRQVNLSIKDISSLNNLQTFLKTNNIRFNNKPAISDLSGTISKIREKLGLPL